MINLISIMGIFILDRIAKCLIVYFLLPNRTIHVTNFFNITYVQNKGMAFGIMNTAASSTGTFVLIVGVNLLAIIILLLWLIKPGTNRWMTTGISFIISGAMGNLVDRLLYKSVIDFLDFHVGHYHWPAFNIADAAVTIGTVLLGIGFLIRERYASRSL